MFLIHLEFNNKSVKILLRLVRHNYVIGLLTKKRKSGMFLEMRKPMSIFVLLANSFLGGPYVQDWTNKGL